MFRVFELIHSFFYLPTCLLFDFAITCFIFPTLLHFLLWKNDPHNFYFPNLNILAAGFPADHAHARAFNSYFPLPPEGLGWPCVYKPRHTFAGMARRIPNSMLARARSRRPPWQLQHLRYGMASSVPNPSHAFAQGTYGLARRIPNSIFDRARFALRRSCFKPLRCGMAISITLNPRHAFV